MILVRQATCKDVHAIREIFLACYGTDYSPRFYDQSYLTKLLECGENLVLIAESGATGQVLGTAAVDFEGEPGSNLVGHFGRLAVHPAFRQRGLGNLLMRERIMRVEERLELGLAEARAAQAPALRIAESHQFRSVGFLPLKLRLREPESFVLLVRHFGKSLELRKSCPRVTSAVHPLARLALENCGLAADAIADEGATALVLPSRPRSFAAEHLCASECATIFDNGTGHLHGVESLGRASIAVPPSLGRMQSIPPARLVGGDPVKFNALTKESVCLAAREQERIAGAIEFTVNLHHRTVSILKILVLQFPGYQVIEFLLSEAERTWTEKLGGAPRVVEIDVMAEAPRTQRTLGDLGFVPVAYIPAFAMVGMERVDVVKMFRVAGPVRIDTEGLTPQSKPMAELVLSGFERANAISSSR